MEMKPLSRNLALKALKYNENEAFEPQPCCGLVARQSINKSRPTKPTQNRNLALKAMNYNENEAFEPQPCSKSNEIQ